MFQVMQSTRGRAFRCLAAWGLCLFWVLFGACAAQSPPPDPRLIAHAGGEIDGLTYTNCREALELSYERGLRYFELDFIPTTDGHFICVHSYDGFMEKFFGAERRACSYAEWQGFSMINGYTKLDMEGAMQWLSLRKDAYIITDIKGDSLAALAQMAAEYPQLRSRIIPQIYAFEEYEAAAALGFAQIILTLYRAEYTNEEVAAFAREHPLFGVTMHLPKGETELPRLLAPTRSFVHTVNEPADAARYFANGAYGLYTDSLTIKDVEQYYSPAPKQ